MVIKIAADRPQAVSLHIRLNSLLRYTVQTKGEKTLILNGKAPAYVANRDYDPHQVVYDDKRGTQFKVQVELLPDGGHCEANDSALTVRNANEVVLLLSAVTDFGNKKMTLKNASVPIRNYCNDTRMTISNSSTACNYHWAQRICKKKHSPPTNV